MSNSQQPLLVVIVYEKITHRANHFFLVLLHYDVYLHYAMDTPCVMCLIFQTLYKMTFFDCSVFDYCLGGSQQAIHHLKKRSMKGTRGKVVEVERERERKRGQDRHTHI